MSKVKRHTLSWRTNKKQKTMKKVAMLMAVMATTMMVTSCKKKKQEYQVTYTVTGHCAYTYSQGANNGSGNCNGSYSFNRTAESGDYVELDATAYSTAGMSDTVGVEISVSPSVNGAGVMNVGFKNAHANVYLK